MRDSALQIPKPVIAIIVVLFFGFFLFADRLFESTPSFPDLASGAYVGEISGIVESERSTIYVERLDGIDAVLLVVFREGSKPRIHQLQTIAVEDASAEEAPLWQPLTLSIEERLVTLSGEQTGSRYEGSLTEGENTLGSWSLEKVDSKQLRRNVFENVTDFNLTTWLTQKGIYRTLFEEEQILDTTIREGEEKLQKLEAYVAEGDELRARAKTRRAALEDEIQLLKKKRGEKLRELKQYVREIDQLNRITKKGRTIELARRVSKRENKWYLVHWQQGMDLSALEETLAASLNVDLRKVNVQLERAKEIESLQHTITLERARIRKLKKMYQEKLDGPKKKAPKKNDSPQERPWYKRWDTVFG